MQYWEQQYRTILNFPALFDESGESNKRENEYSFRYWFAHIGLVPRSFSNFVSKNHEKCILPICDRIHAFGRIERKHRFINDASASGVTSNK